MAGLADLRMGCQDASRLHVTTNLLRELETGRTLLVQTSRMDAISGWEALNHLCMASKMCPLQMDNWTLDNRQLKLISRIKLSRA